MPRWAVLFGDKIQCHQFSDFPGRDKCAFDRTGGFERKVASHTDRMSFSFGKNISVFGWQRQPMEYSN
jgi:hypothetical protein